MPSQTETVSRVNLTPPGPSAEEINTLLKSGRCHFWRTFETFQRRSVMDPEAIEIVSPLMTMEEPWSELIPSWNLKSTQWGRIEVQAVGKDWSSGWYAFGQWSLDTNLVARTSLRGQRDDLGAVLTDTLVVRRPAIGARVRVTFGNLDGSDSSPDPDFLAWTWSPWEVGNGKDGDMGPSPSILDPIAGHDVVPVVPPMAVPILLQTSHPDGVRSWCSPASVAMVLGWWSGASIIGDPRQHLESVAQAVYDPAWGGTGNWAFNTAFAGSLSGLESCVMRFRSLDELRPWLAAGCPVIVSISNSLLKGVPRVREFDGHLVVVVGMESDGSVWINDPGVRPELSRRRISGQQFATAWASSKNTAYLIWPNPKA